MTLEENQQLDLFENSNNFKTLSEISQKNLVVYRSSAGSGKTYTLAINYIAISLSNYKKQKNYYRKVLAITFTNKAAKEMKERILLYLKTLSKKQDIDNILEKVTELTGLEKEEVFYRSKNIYFHIIHNYSDLAILTIDKFYSKIIRTFSKDLNISSDFELILDRDQIIKPAVSLFIGKVNDKNLNISDLLVEFALQKTFEGNSNLIQPDLENYCQNLFNENSNYYLSQSEFKPKNYKEIIRKIFEKKEFSRNKILLLHKKVSTFFLDNNLTIEHFNKGTYYKLFKIKLLSENYNDWIPSDALLRTLDENNLYKKSLDQKLKDQVDSCRSYLKGFIEELLLIIKDYITINSSLKKIYPSIIINELIKEIEHFTKEQNLQHISSFNKKIHTLVTDQSSSFIYERIGERFSHFMIDEFQDTSLLQWQNILPLITDSIDHGKSILVGDGKQSIYRWRSGEVEQFLKLPKIFKGKHLSFLRDWENKLDYHYDEKDWKETSENFRSKKEIIHFNNDFFSKAKNRLSESLINIYKNHKQNSNYSKEGGYVRIELFDGVNYRNEILSRILNEIELILNKKYSYKDISILCNTHSDITEVAEFLSKRKIPIVSNDGLLISTSLEVRTIVSFIKYVHDNNDDVAKCSIVNYLHSKKIINNDLHVTLTKIKNNNYFISLLKSCGIEMNINRIIQLPLFEMIQQIIKCLKIESDVYVDFFNDLILSYSAKNLNNFVDFINWWDTIKNKKSISISEEIDAVNLITIHKAKGLAFDIVIIPFNWESNVRKELWVENNSLLSSELKYSLIYQNKNLKHSHYSNQNNREDDLSMLDNLNKLYVACTRARDGLYIFSKSFKKVSKNSKNLNSILSSFTNVFPYERGILNEKVILEKEQKNIFLSKKVNTTNWKKLLIIKKNISDYYDFEGQQQKRNWGKLFHHALSMITYYDQKDDVLDGMYNLGICSKKEKEKINKELKKLFSNEKIKNFFNYKWEVKAEKEILLPSGKTYIPDRLLFNDDEVVIIDYKTGEFDSKNEEQIIKYENVLKNMGYQNISKYLIYTSLDKKLYRI